MFGWSDGSPMPATHSTRRRRTGVVPLLVLLSVPGCLGGFGGPGGPAVSDETARERALTAEERHLRDRLGNASCVDGWGTNSYTGVEAEANVVNRTSAGVYVDVVHPFWYGTETVEADGRSAATYLVTPNATRRLDGTTIAPC